MAFNIPTNQRKVKLIDGNEIPAIGLGTYLSAPSEVTNAVIAGLVLRIGWLMFQNPHVTDDVYYSWKAGMRHFDLAQFYKVRSRRTRPI